MLKNISQILALVLLLICPNLLYSQENSTELFQKGNRYYDSSNFKSAIQAYQQLLNRGIKDATVYYNLGNAYFRDKQLGKAILYYRKAQRLSPRDSDIATNLSYSRLFVLDKIKSSSNFSSAFIDKTLNWGTVNEFTFLTFLFYLGSASLGIVTFFKREKIIKRGLAVFLAFFLVLILFATIKISRDSQWQEAVVTSSAVEVYSGPAKEFTLQFTGHEGLELKIEQEKDDWYLAALPNGAKGWLPKASVEKI
ncbi:MAG: hypothetical protein RBG1_1C00001G1772 [candidate division Zixibacteria bacterium RBG-1]|nr:MAG: hypothetical protein RBG1_1C00001G1772 [candidate division Zixibacteria bacterium RBG-1]OGC85372.1 MAG: hypothetical protein A2V73_09170 [candidate division Zixibacteria bacterium RBG_19FT_COMBO_42_43]